MAIRLSKSQLLFFGGAFLIFAVIQILVSFQILNTFWNTIIRLGSVMAMVAIGLNLIYGFNGQFSLGQWGFYAIGAYSAADITYRWNIEKSTLGLCVIFLGVITSGLAIIALRRVFSRVRGLDTLSAFTLYLIALGVMIFISFKVGQFLTPAMNALFLAMPAFLSMEIIFLLAVILAGFIAAEVSFMFGLPVLTLGSDYFGIATLGFTIIVKVLLDNSDTMFGLTGWKGARGMVGIPKIGSWFWVFLFLFLVIWVTRNLLHSTYGRAIISVREDEIAAKAMGVDIADYKIITFVIGSFFAGLGGGLYAHINGFLHPNTFDFIASFNPLIIVVMGGVGSVTGTVAASWAWALILEGVLRLILPQGFETWRFVVYPLLLLLLMLLRPAGLLGGYEIPFIRQVIPALPRALRKREEPIREVVGEVAE